jgi:hypothetical protein
MGRKPKTSTIKAKEPATKKELSRKRGKRKFAARMVAEKGN